MPSFEEARKLILEQVVQLGAEILPSVEAVGRVLAVDVSAPWDFPLWDNSAMDGYAVRAQEVTGAVALKLCGYLAAGEPGAEPLVPGTVARILTGAPLPPGADAVVPQEDTEERNGMVLFRQPIKMGANVRRQGEDMRTGEIILRAGTILGAPEVSALASCSRLSIPVIRQPRVAILSTGDELVEPGEPLSPGKIYNSNAMAVAAAVRLAGAEPTILEIARDEHDALRRLLSEGLQADVLVTSAGVSMGDRDLVRQILQELAVQQVFWKVDIKPGRPTAFGRRGATLVFSLPGNPVSTLLSFEEFVRPALLRMMGHRKVFRPLVRATLQDEIRARPGRVTFTRVRLERRREALLAWSAGKQETGILKTMLQADGIAVLPADGNPAAPGTTVDVQVIRSGFEMLEE